MTAERTNQAAGLPGVADAELARLATRAIAVLLSERGVAPPSVESRLSLLCDAFLSERESTRHAILTRMRMEGVSAEDIIDVVLPAIARNAGRLWMADEISFADVTIITARLQETVRALGRVRRDSPTTDRRAVSGPDSTGSANARKRVLLIIPRPEEHTFGAFVVADQIRRHGYEVDVAMDLHPRQVAEKVRKTPYHMIGITASGRRSLASARELVDIIRTSVTRVTHIVLGGSVVEVGRNLKAMTGVDHVLCDVPSALRACGLLDEDETAVHDAP